MRHPCDNCLCHRSQPHSAAFVPRPSIEVRKKLSFEAQIEGKHVNKVYSNKFNVSHASGGSASLSKHVGHLRSSGVSLLQEPVRHSGAAHNGNSTHCRTSYFMPHSMQRSHVPPGINGTCSHWSNCTPCACDGRTSARALDMSPMPKEILGIGGAPERLGGGGWRCEGRSG